MFVLYCTMTTATISHNCCCCCCYSLLLYFIISLLFLEAFVLHHFPQVSGIQFNMEILFIYATNVHTIFHNTKQMELLLFVVEMSEVVNIIKIKSHLEDNASEQILIKIHHTCRYQLMSP